MSPLPSEERRALLELARRAIVETVQARPAPEVSRVSLALGERAGAFVSLHLRGRLRGCIGQVEPVEALAEAVARCAVAAAVEDPRFEPVSPGELADLEIEISILSPLTPIQPEEIEVGKHGLLVTRDRMRGLLLPQVATQYHWPRERFLEEACRKAGLERDAWKDPASRIEAFTAEVFSEADFRDERRARAS
jgi:AmmeMemoRadiSam system protein A